MTKDERERGRAPRQSAKDESRQKCQKRRFEEVKRVSEVLNYLQATKWDTEAMQANKKNVTCHDYPKNEASRLHNQ